LNISLWGVDRHNLVLGDFDGNGTSDIILQGIDSTQATYYLKSNKE